MSRTGEHPIHPTAVEPRDLPCSSLGMLLQALAVQQPPFSRSYWPHCSAQMCQTVAVPYIINIHPSPAAALWLYRQAHCALDQMHHVPCPCPVPSPHRFDWRQVWSCLERAQAGPWQLDARRLTPAAFPHGVLLTFELLFQQPAPATELGAREQQSGGWRDCVTVLSFTLDGRTVEITVDASGR